MGYVYIITNTVNGKSYIGISIHEPEKRRIKEHLSGRGNQDIADDINIYGKDAFTYEILEDNVFNEFLPDLEVAYIASFNTVAPHGYNQNSGGFHAIPSAETRRKISEAQKGKKLTEEHRRKVSESLTGEKNPFFGKKHTPETLLKISNANKGRNPHNFGKKTSPEVRHKISESRRGKHKGEKNPFFGKKHTPETLLKISNANKGRKLTEETRRKLSEAGKNRIVSAETRRKLSKINRGKTFSEETRRKLSEARRLPEYTPAHVFFFSLPADMPLKEKRMLLYTMFPNVEKRTIRYWVNKWSKENP